MRTPTAARLRSAFVLAAATAVLVGCGSAVTGSPRGDAGSGTAGVSTGATSEASTTQPTSADSSTGLDPVVPSSQEEAVPTSAPTESNDSVESTGTDTASPVVPPTAPEEPAEEDPTVPPEGWEGGPDDHPYWDPELNLLSWSSPTGNISCHLQATAEVVTCTAFEHSIEPTENCHAAQPVVAELEPGGVHQGCRSDVTPVGRVLPYGESIVMGSITCISLETGMTCDNGDLAFSLSRTALNFAG